MQDGMFKYIAVDDIVIDVHPQHKCPSKASLSLCCIDRHGNIDYNLC